MLKAISDARLKELWRSVNGRFSELNGPLIRFAGLVAAEVAVPSPEGAGSPERIADSSLPPIEFSQPDDFEWARERVVRMCGSAYADAMVYRTKLLKGFGYPNETFARAQDARALNIVLQKLATLLAAGEAREGAAALRAEIERIVSEMRAEGPRYKSHVLGFVDSVSANSVDEWADELEALVRDAAPAPLRDLAMEVAELAERCGQSVMEKATNDPARLTPSEEGKAIGSATRTSSSSPTTGAP